MGRVNCQRCINSFTARARQRKSNFSPAEYEKKLVEQNGRCAVCGGQPKGRALSADHDHATGSPRGLLCLRCNAALGYAQEDPGRLRALLAYLAKWKKRRH